MTQLQLNALNKAIEEEHERRLLKSRLVAMFSHDFRNPLTSILSSAELIKKYEDHLTAERKHQHLDRISGSVHLLLQMLDDMLAVAEMEHNHLEFRPQSIDIVSFIRNVVDEFQLTYGERYTFLFEDQFSETVISDPKLLRQILTNLMSNAVKYSPPNSMVTVRLLPHSGGFEIHVVDEGYGMSEKDIHHLFDAFYRADNAKNVKGTGLGLTIVQESVVLCGGSIRVSSEIEKGSTFVVELPLMPPNEA